MKNIDARTVWADFLRWKGWTAMASFYTKAWRATVSWQGWKILFGIPFPVVMILSVSCAVGLIWVFCNGMETSMIAYCLYPLSFYCLTALSVKLPAAVGGGKEWFIRHPKLTALLHNNDLRFRLELYLEQFINFTYGSLKIVSGITLGSAWIGCDGIYNLTQAAIQLFQILRRKKAGTMLQQWKSYRLCGYLILLLHLSLIGIVFQMVNWNRAEEQGEILVIATAAFAFYKVISSFIRIAKDRRHFHPVDSSIRMLNLAQAIFAIFSLQASMFHAFGTGADWEQVLNIITGSTVCLLIVSTGVYMIRRGNREIRNIKETDNGK